MEARFTIFEHEALVIDNVYDGIVFTTDHHKYLETFFREKDFPYYTLIRNGVRFCEYVGVLQVGNMVIEVFPKADDKGKEHWKKMLIGMLKAVDAFDIHAPSYSSLHLKSNSILDLYIELFITEVESLLKRGLIKKYNQLEGNTTSLKGSLVFSKNIQHNLVHRERFYVRHTVYNQQYILHGILYKAIKLLRTITVNKNLYGRIGALMLDFPEMNDLKITDSLFSKITYTRKNQAYKKAIEIARLLLLNYHPDVLSGKNNVLAIMFDMNLLWEQFVFRSLKKHNSNGYHIKPQSEKFFWKRKGGNRRKMIPDIVIDCNNGSWVVLDTKWKNIGDSNPSPEDLRQMYVYSKYHQKAKTSLVYPGDVSDFTEGNFLDEVTGKETDNVCGIMTLEVGKDTNSWQKEIACFVFGLSLFT